MIATSGFGESYPVLIYGYEKSQKEVDFSLGRNLIDDEANSDEKDTQISTPRKERSQRESVISEDTKSDGLSFNKGSPLSEKASKTGNSQGYKTPVRSDHDRRFDD